MQTVINFLEEMGFKPKKVSSSQSSEYKSPCPACQGKDRFKSWPAEGKGGRFWCRQCGIKGDGIDFLKRFMNLSFKDAAVLVGKDLSPQITHTLHISEKEDLSIARQPSKIWQQKGLAFVNWSCNNLPEGMHLLAKRGIKELTAQKYKLGFNPRDWRLRGKEWGIEDKENLFIPKGLVIPFFDTLGHLQQIKIRQIERDPKYFIIAGSGNQMFIANYQEGVPVVLLESELDAIALIQECENVCIIATGGISKRPCAFIDNIIKSAPTLLHCPDWDQDASKIQKSVSIWERYKNYKCWPVPETKSVGDFFIAGGDLKTWLTEGLREDNNEN